jgi:putative ubiquitin-RnfH superfamily antitoxin RatB of RatAB toxin-antitoxin module
MSQGDLIPVEVAYALPHQQAVLKLDVPQGTQLGQAIERSGILGRFPEIDLTQCRVGIYGKLSSLDAVLRPGDRIEIYRPLQADPKEVRRQRAARKDG